MKYLDRAATVTGSVLILLRLEGLAVAAVSAVLYARTGASWGLFAALWLVPDLSMLGYLAGSCWGARMLQRRAYLRGARRFGAERVAAARQYACCRSRSSGSITSASIG